MITPIPADTLANLPGPARVKLRKELMDAFPEPRAAREVAIAAGVNPHDIFWGQCARDLWCAIFDEDHKYGRGHMARLYSAALKAEAEQGLNGTCSCREVA